MQFTTHKAFDGLAKSIGMSPRDVENMKADFSKQYDEKKAFQTTTTGSIPYRFKGLKCMVDWHKKTSNSIELESISH